MLEHDPTDYPERKRKRLPIVFMKPYEPIPEPEEIPGEDDRGATNLALEALTLLRNKWHDIIDPHRKNRA